MNLHRRSRKSIFTLLGLDALLLLTLAVLPALASAGAPANQSVGAAKGTTSTPTCNFNGASITAGSLLVVSGVVESSSITVNSIAKSAGTGTSTGWASVVEKTGGSTVTERAFIWAGIMSATGTQTVTITFSGTTTQSYITCFSESGASYLTATTQTGAGTYTSGTSVTMGLTSNLVPTAGDLVYVVAGVQGCGATSSPTYDQTSMSGRGTDFTGGSTCNSSYRLNIQDEYKLPADATAVTGAMGLSWATTITSGTWGYVEVAADFKQTVTQPYKLTVQPAGAPTASTITPSGCGEYQTFAGDGAAHNIQEAASCTPTLTMQAGGANDRWCFNNAGACSQTLTSNTTCSSGTCTESDARYWKQLQNTYKASANGKTTFDSGLSTITVKGTFIGTTGTTLCGTGGQTGAISPTSGDANDGCNSQAGVAVWADYNTAVNNYPATVFSNSTMQWAKTAACSFTLTSGGNTQTCPYWKQWNPTLTVNIASYTGSPATFDAAMTEVVYANQFNSAVTLCTITVASGSSSDSCTGTNWIDHGSYVVFARRFGSPPANEAWACATCTNGPVQTSATVTISFYDQLAETWTAQIGGSVPAFDNGLSSAVKGQVMGTAAQTICTVNTYGSASTSQACNGNFAFVQSVTVTASASTATGTFASGMTYGNTVFASVTSWDCDSPPTAPTLSIGQSVLAVSMTNVGSSPIITQANTAVCTATFEARTYIFAARVTLPDKDFTGAVIKGVSLTCAAGNTCNAAFSEWSGAMSITPDSTATNSGTGTTVTDSFTPTAGRFVFVAAGACGTATYTAGSGYTSGGQLGGGTCTSGSASIDTRAFGEGKTSAGAAESSVATLGSSEQYTAIAAWFPTGNAAIDYGKAATFDTDMTGAPASTKWECGTCVTSSQTAGGGTPTITYFKQLQNTYQCTPSSPATWDAIYVCKTTGTVDGVAGQQVSSVNTVAGGGAISTTGYADYGATVTFTTPLGNTWTGQAPLSFSDTTTGNTHNVNYVQSSSTTTTTTSTTTVTTAIDTQFPWWILIPVAFALLLIVRRRFS